MKQFITLIKREFWEHKTSTFYAPLILSFGLILLILFSGIRVQTGVSAVKTLSFGLSLGTMPSILLFVLPLLMVIYALNSLYEERKNKSLLFWRSMPVSDTKTVLSKVFFAVIGIPMLFIIAWFVVTSLSFVINFGMTYLFDASNILGNKNGFKFLISLVSTVSLSFLVLSIMMLPYYTYLTFISAISTGSPLLIAILPFLALTVANMLIPEIVLVYDYILMPFDLGVRTSIEIAKTLSESTGLVDMLTEGKGGLMQKYQDFFNSHNMEIELALTWNERDIYTLFASIISSVTFVTLAIFARKRIQSV